MAQKWLKITQNSPKLPKLAQKWPKIAQMDQNWPKMAQKLAPAEEKNSTDISAGSATFCISGGWGGDCDHGEENFLEDERSVLKMEMRWTLRRFFFVKNYKLQRQTFLSLMMFFISPSRNLRRDYSTSGSGISNKTKTKQREHDQ